MLTYQSLSLQWLALFKSSQPFLPQWLLLTPLASLPSVYNIFLEVCSVNKINALVQFFFKKKTSALRVGRGSMQYYSVVLQAVVQTVAKSRQISVPGYKCFQSLTTTSSWKKTVFWNTSLRNYSSAEDSA